MIFLEIFELILLMLSAIALSNLINRFIPSVSVPIIQIALGVGLTFLPAVHFELQLNPELFLLLFIAPLLFNDGRMSDRQTLWTLKKPILLLALGLVFFTVGLLGYMLNWLIPAIPLAAAFALAAALAPTDAIAVGALEDKVVIPHRTMKILEGESLINDASGLVSFQFAAAAMVTGAFSLKSAGLAFVGISIGGIVLGLLMTFAKQIFVTWLRKLGMENVTLHMLIEVLTPFIIFLTAEELGVNGILAAVSAGIAHSFGYRKLNPEVARLNIVSKSTWSVIVYVLNGLVFLLLGTQLPEIVKVVWESEEINNLAVIAYTLLLTVMLLGLRFIWVLITKVGQSDEEPKGNKFKNALIFSLAGVRGTITLASTLSLPFLLDNGSEFPQRNLIIFLAAGVILWTLLAANYLLPLLIENEAEAQNDESEVELEIMRSVMASLNEQVTTENSAAVRTIIGTYHQRIRKLKRSDSRKPEVHPLLVQTLKWQKEYTVRAIQDHSVNSFSAYRYLRRLNSLLFRFTRDPLYKAGTPLLPSGSMKELSEVAGPAALRFNERRADKEAFRARVSDYVIDRLKAEMSAPQSEFDIEDLSGSLLRYEQMTGRLARSSETNTGPRERPAVDMDELDEIARIGIQLERDQIQQMFEAGRLSRSGMKELKNNLLLMEHDLRDLAI
ncbi:Na+/H+ antiporter [Saccharibacillus sp. CPCC 101409]|uniref:Na+/H+ antiporter n=1 Tax=Saccharibacillus sp. CPCC 101409 TaxID=3058041 RepID=UPI002670E191|nr:Na+/H+ antiporter [Saccharibacillus sp. CPCC 101409]MDO3410535.1 Na+/H+ antiporter [Saccharibacillus sp. CPCC 101409]